MRKMKDSGIEWIGEIPESWDVSKSKYFYTCLDGRRVPLDASQRNPGQYPYWGAGSIMDYIDDFIFDEEIVLLGEDGAPFFDKNRPVSFVVNEKVWVNNHIHVIKPNSDVNAKFMMYWFNTVDYGTYINGSILNKLTQSNMDNIAFVKVPYDEQVQIVNYLDQKCAEIDAIIAAKEKTNELLKERRQSIIYEAVTKGLDPTVPMKDSGVEWIGTIPSTWEIRKLRYLGSCSNGISKAGEFFGSGSPFVSYGDVYKNMELPRDVSGLIETTAEEQQLYSVEEGDVFFTRTSETIEEVAISSTCMQTIENATFAGFLIRFRPNTELLTKEFSKYYFRSEMHRFFFVKEMNLVTRASLSQDLLKKLPVLLPPVEEQKRIASYLDTECSNIDKLIATNESTIEKLKEYRQSVIYEAVTGKIEV